MLRTFRLTTLVAALVVAVAAQAPSAQAAQAQTLAAGEWFVQTPAKGFKDLPSLAAERDFSNDDTLANMIFVCDRAKYYLLLIGPTFKFAKSEPGTVTLGAAAQHHMIFQDLYGTRAPLGKKFDRDASILFAPVSKAMLAQLRDGGTLRVDLNSGSWSMALTGIAAKVPTFTTFCETGRKANRAHFAQ